MSDKRGPCPYCHRGVPEVTYEGREHVIPQAFGRFTQNNLIARNVCDHCNHVFSGGLDLLLARGTYEGWQRFRVGGRSPSAYRHVGRASRVQVRGAEGPWRGMVLHQRVSEDGEALLVEPARQIGLARSAEDQATYYELHDAPAPDVIRELYGGTPYARLIGFETDAEITDALENLGFAALEEIERDHSIVTDGTTTSRVRADCRADKDVFRAISKIAMNYLDAVHPAVSRLPQFHEMASYVLSGRDPSHRPVRAGFERIIGNEPVGRRYLGHIVTVRHDPATDAIMSDVSLYNEIRYRVTLSPSGFLCDVPREFLTSGHLFDTHNHIVHELRHSSLAWRRLLVPIPE